MGSLAVVYSKVAIGQSNRGRAGIDIGVFGRWVLAQFNMGSFMRRIAKVAVAVAVLLLAWSFGGQTLLDRGTARGVFAAKGSLSGLGIVVDDVLIGGTEFTLPFVAKWLGVEVRVTAKQNSAIMRNAGFEGFVESVSLEPSSWLFGKWNLRMSGVECRSVFVASTDMGPEIGELWLSIGRLEKEVVVSPSTIREDIEVEYRALFGLVNRGLIRDPIFITGAFGFKFNGAPVSIRFKSEQRGGSYGLLANIEDVRALSKLYSLSLTEAELKIVSKYPIQAPGMLRIQSYASNSAMAAQSRDRTVPQDAYRHLLWSYLLTNKFGPELAEEITDAHELGSTTNTEADHRMDYHNNELGRSYAMGNRRESEVLSLAKSDPNVVRSAR